MIGVLGLGRTMAESRMSDACMVSRGPAEVLDPVTDTWVPNPAASVYSGKCRVKHPTTAGRDVDAGSQLVVVSQVEVHLPLSAVGVLPGDDVVITSCPSRPDQVGRKFTIDAPFDGSQTTALRFRVGVADGR